MMLGGVSNRTRIVAFTLTLLFGVFSHGAYRIDQWIPQTHTLPAGAMQVAVERKATMAKEATQSPNTSVLGTSFGLWGNENVGVEGGLDWEEPANEQFTRAIFGHLRIRAKDLEKDKWSFALGIEKLGFVSNKNDINMIYLTFQNQIADLWLVGVGGYNGSSRFLVDETGKDDPRGAFVGVWRQIQRRRGRLAFEYQSGRSFVGYIFAGMTLELSDLVYGTIGYGHTNNDVLGKDWVLARMSADF
jgi:hypothetical protein